MDRLHERNIGVDGFFVRREGVGNERNRADSALDGVQHGEAGEYAHRGALFQLVESTPALDVIRERNFLW